MVEISRLADNLQWLVDILIDRRVADDFIRMWAHQADLAHLHSNVPVMFRYQISCLTARLCIAIGKGQASHLHHLLNATLKTNQSILSGQFANSTELIFERLSITQCVT